MLKPAIISGKPPAFKKPLFMTRPNQPGKKELFQMTARMMKNRWLTNFGEFHNEFAGELKKLLGVSYVLPCCNATMGLFLLLRVLELKGKVITTPFTFPATIHSITMAGLEPLFCDISPDDYTLDMESVSKNISQGVSAILAVNIFGNICDVERLDYLSKKHNIPVIYDSAHAFYSRYKGRMVGGFGRAEVFSFHAAKFFNTLEGGAVATNDGELYGKLRLLMNFGIKNEESVIGMGLNGKMSEMNAIFGLLNLRKVKENKKRLGELSALYRKKLSVIKGIKFQLPKPDCETNGQYMPVEIIEAEYGLNRNELYAVLRTENVFARKYFYPPAYDYECYRNSDFSKVELPGVDLVSKRILCLPLFVSMKTNELGTVCELLKSIQCHSVELRNKLQKE
jgi:dTDP-4-amino-4,6-dideoxygalactose transaminase